MRIAIIGPGAMGGLFGAMLSGIVDVTLLGRPGEHVERMRTAGLILTRRDGTQTCKPVQAVSDPSRFDGKADVAVIFTKSYDTAEAAKTAAAVLHREGLALTLQNGLGNAQRISAAVGPERTAAGVTSQAATLVAPGHVRHAGEGPTHLAALTGNDDRITAIAAILNQAGIPTQVSDDVDRLIWGKLIVNVGINALTAILRVPNGILDATPACRLLMAQAVEEAVAVAKAHGMILPFADPLAHVREVCVRTASNRASMLQDILRGRRTEIDVINGAIVEKGRAASIPTPVNRLITELVKALEETAHHRIL